VINLYQYNFVQFSRCSRRNTGNEFATSFSNSAQSYKIALDFMLGENTWKKQNHPIRWFEKGINSNARERAIVIHGAEYVSSSFIQKTND
jgi:hypothetical protein